MTTVTIRDLTFGYPGESALFDGLSCRLGGAGAGGCVSAVMGSSGVGKSTLLRLIAQLEEPGDGSSLTFEPELSQPPVFLTQDAILLDHYSRNQNARYRSSVGSQRDSFDSDTFDAVKSALDLGGSFLSDSRPMQPVSGGERQRLALLRDLSVRPAVMLLDEPCQGLDRRVKVRLLRQIRELAMDLQLLVVLATHHVDEIMLAADEVIYLEREATGAPVTKAQACLTRGFVAAPPTLEACESAASPIVNILPCRPVGTETLWQPTATPEARHHLALAPECVFPGDAGFGVSDMRSGPIFAWCMLRDSNLEIAMRYTAAMRPPTALALRGASLLYSLEADRPRPVMVDTLVARGKTCLTIQPSS